MTDLELSELARGDVVHEETEAGCTPFTVTSVRLAKASKYHEAYAESRSGIIVVRFTMTSETFHRVDACPNKGRLRKVLRPSRGIGKKGARR
ncbi:MAG: hypothetical protein ACREQ5_11440 [Candidatus Dormibacteria bacterium]